MFKSLIEFFANPNNMQYYHGDCRCSSTYLQVSLTSRRNRGPETGWLTILVRMHPCTSLSHRHSARNFHLDGRVRSALFKVTSVSKIWHFLIVLFSARVDGSLANATRREAPRLNSVIRHQNLFSCQIYRFLWVNACQQPTSKDIFYTEMIENKWRDALSSYLKNITM